MQCPWQSVPFRSVLYGCSDERSLRSISTATEVETLIGLKASQVYVLVKRGEFPAPIKIGAASRWSLRAVSAWMDARVKEAEA